MSLSTSLNALSGSLTNVNTDGFRAPTSLPSSLPANLPIPSPDPVLTKLNLAINGSGFFQVLVPGSDKVLFTRVGDFQISDAGIIETAFGEHLHPEVELSDGWTSVTVEKDGSVKIEVTGQEEETVVGRVELVTFGNEKGLNNTGNGRYEEGEESGEKKVGVPGTEGFGEIVQSGETKKSGEKQSVEDLANRIAAERMYEDVEKVTIEGK